MFTWRQLQLHCLLKMKQWAQIILSFSLFLQRKISAELKHQLDNAAPKLTEVDIVLQGSDTEVHPWHQFSWLKRSVCVCLGQGRWVFHCNLFYWSYASVLRLHFRICVVCTLNSFKGQVKMKLHSDARIPLTAGQSAIVTESPEVTFLIFAGFDCHFLSTNWGGETRVVAHSCRYSSLLQTWAQSSRKLTHKCRFHDYFLTWICEFVTILGTQMMSAWKKQTSFNEQMPYHQQDSYLRLVLVLHMLSSCSFWGRVDFNMSLCLTHELDDSRVKTQFVCMSKWKRCIFNMFMSGWETKMCHNRANWDV